MTMPGFGPVPDVGARIVPCRTTPPLPTNDTSVVVTPGGAALDGDAGNPNVTDAMVMTVNILIESVVRCRIAVLPSARSVRARFAGTQPMAKGENT
jgi:hypothetical protein